MRMKMRKTCFRWNFLRRRILNLKNGKGQNSWKRSCLKNWNLNGKRLSSCFSKVFQHEDLHSWDGFAAVAVLQAYFVLRVLLFLADHNFGYFLPEGWYTPDLTWVGYRPVGCRFWYYHFHSIATDAVQRSLGDCS
jgi:hypothetical protein